MNSISAQPRKPLKELEDVLGLKPAQGYPVEHWKKLGLQLAEGVAYVEGRLYTHREVEPFEEPDEDEDDYWESEDSFEEEEWDDLCDNPDCAICADRR